MNIKRNNTTIDYDFKSILVSTWKGQSRKDLKPILIFRVNDFLQYASIRLERKEMSTTLRQLRKEKRAKA